MRIKAIRLAWFRGAADPVTLPADAKSICVYGPNGAGKSSFVDSIEYSINSGKIAHLSHEYSGRNQEKAIRNTHTPVGTAAEFCITFQDDSELNVKIAPNGSHTRTGAEAVNIGGWDYRRTVLRQDEVAEFIRSRKGEKYSALLPLFGLHELEIAAENLRQLPKAIEQQSKLAQKKGALDQTNIKREKAFGKDDDVAIDSSVADLYKKYCPNGAATDVLACGKELGTALIHRISATSNENQRYLALQMIADTDVAGSVRSVREANAKLAGSVEPLITEKLEILQSTNAFVAKLNDRDEIPCPACGQPISVEKYKAHVKAEQDRLKEIIAVFEERRFAISKLIDCVKTLKTALAKHELKEWCGDA